MFLRNRDIFNRESSNSNKEKDNSINMSNEKSLKQEGEKKGMDEEIENVATKKNKGGIQRN